MSKKETHTWLDRHKLIDPEHTHELETSAAVNEFHRGMPRDVAEKTAYEEYSRKHRLKAAAFHLLGMKAAQAAGATDEAHKHYLQYDTHLKSLGLESAGIVPPEVEGALKDEDHKAPYKFKGHGADILGETMHDPMPPPEPIVKSESKQCQWKLGERRCKRFTISKYCHAHRKHE